MDSLPQELKILLLNASGFDWNEIEKSCSDELIEGFELIQFSVNESKHT